MSELFARMHSAACLRGLVAAGVAVSDLLTLYVSAADEHPSRQLSAGVKLIASAGPDETSSMPANPADDRSEPTTPGGRLPQYQLDYRHRSLPSQDQLESPHIRLLMALPERPVVVEAEITIDGVAFRSFREHRIASILAELSRPEAAEPPLPTVEDSNDSGSVADSASSVTSPPAQTDGSPESETTGAGDKEAESISNQPDDAAETTEPAVPPVNPPTVDPYRLPSSVVDRLRRQQSATGQAPTQDEIRWLLTNWVDGPSLLMLRDNFQRFRANERPVFQLLDRDRDGVISKDEITSCVKSFQECDFNRNDIIEYTEIERVSRDPRHRRNLRGRRLLFLLSGSNDSATLHRQIVDQYSTAELKSLDTDGNGVVDEAEVDSLLTGNPSLVIKVEFHSTNHEQSRVTVIVPDGTESRPVTADTVDQQICMQLAGAPIVISAAQGTASDQVSVGAVVDGYPMLPVVDVRPDGQFTIRELRELEQRVSSFDRNGDGIVTADEAASTIRLCFGLGPVVHRELATLRDTTRGELPAIVQGPEWFIRMDRNRDNDLSRGEFPGTDNQWALLDSDQDELVSAEEALEFDKQSGQSSERKPAARDEDRENNDVPPESASPEPAP